ncbi:MAG: glycosyltransferase family 4 protein [Sterolibacteriaceae bacterium]|nr:glycosyltransferase family 4 protein [Sterolibacteriaceae bacterium]
MDKIGGQSVQANLILRRLRDEPSLEMAFQPIDPRLPSALRPIQRVKYARTVPTFSLYCAQLFHALRYCDVVHVFSASYFSFVLAATPAIYFARYLRKPVILNYHSGEAEDHLARWPSAVRTLRLADRIVVPSGYLVHVFERFGLQAQTVFNAIDLSAFEFRARANPRPAFLVNRNFEMHYNVACVLRAFALIQRKRPDALLTVAGDGPQRDYLQGLASELSLRNTRFVGRVQPQHMPEMYDEHDIWLNGSDVDNMPLSILEAYACGLAVVSTNPGGIPYIVEDDRTGRLVARGDAEAIADRALELIGDPAFFADLTRNGLAECAKYTWESVRSGWMTLYSELVHRKISRQP